jgi:hypothetical protein
MSSILNIYRGLITGADNDRDALALADYIEQSFASRGLESKYDTAIASFWNGQWTGFASRVIAHREAVYEVAPVATRSVIHQSLRQRQRRHRIEEDPTIAIGKAVKYVADRTASRRAKDAKRANGGDEKKMVDQKSPPANAAAAAGKGKAEAKASAKKGKKEASPTGGKSDNKSEEKKLGYSRVDMVRLFVKRFITSRNRVDWHEEPKSSVCYYQILLSFTILLIYDSLSLRHNGSHLLANKNSVCGVWTMKKLTERKLVSHAYIVY